MMRLLITGGAGFLGSALVRQALRRYPDADIAVLDALTYAGSRANLTEVESGITFIEGDVCDPDVARKAMQSRTHVINAAAETHVDRSLSAPGTFLRTNVEGTRVLLEAARAAQVERFLQVSTDEVYGAVPEPGRSHEGDPLKPSNPYAASKAAADLLAGAYRASYGLPVVITRGANTYGPRQYPEKLVPLFTTNALDGMTLPLYGDGQQVRDWLHVSDHAAGILTVLDRGETGEIYNLAGRQERTNAAIAVRLLQLTDADPRLLRSVPDRPGHDRRYALDDARARSLGWEPRVCLDDGLAETVAWYRDHRAWWERIRESAEFREHWGRVYGRVPVREGFA
ncbi:MAG TPA: dTDP-glucose 4,6-dehydratase [Chloroflexota bacterium]|nr:dTDP-glucose 4,6-dehydratase [Chloroflexota bacterium]